MVRRISLNDAQRDLAALLDGLRAYDDSVIMERDGTPVGVIIPPHVFARLKEEHERNWQLILQERNTHLDPDEVYREVTQIVEEVRQERYEEREAAASNRR